MRGRLPGLLRRAAEQTRRPVVRALIFSGAVACLCKVLGFARDLLVVALYGVVPELDVFFVAAVLPSIMVNALGASLGAALVPRLMQIRTSEGQAAERLAQRRFLGWGVLAIAGCSLGVALAGHWLIPWLAPGFSPEQRTAAVGLLGWLTPYTFCSTVTHLWSLLANADGRYTGTAWGPGVVSVASMAVLLLIPHGNVGWLLATGLTLGGLFDLLINARLLAKSRYSIVPAPAPLTRWDLAVFAEAAPLSLGVLLHAGTLMVDQSMASTLGEGAVSELNYGARLPGVLLGLLGLTFLRIAFPHFARLAAERNARQFHRVFMKYGAVMLAAGALLMIVLAAGSRTIVQLVFQRGKLDAESAERIALIQQMYALQAPFWLWGMLASRAAVALRLHRAVLLGAGVTFIANVVLNSCLIGPLGAPGLALATSGVYAAGCLWLTPVVLWRLRRLQPEEDTPPLPRKTIRAPWFSRPQPPLVALACAPVASPTGAAREGRPGPPADRSGDQG